MAVQEQSCYTLVSDVDDTEPPTEQELKKLLENTKFEPKITALKKTIFLMMKGEKMPSLLMTIIRYVMPCDNHEIKKLLLIFWEIVPKYGPDGKLLHEMILVCDAYRKDLVSPNEYIRGSTLRFLCKLKEPMLLEPLMPSIQENLSNRHAYVRRNAVLAIFTIYKSFDHLIPDAPELIQNFLEQEQDASCKRNAFMMLITADQSRALDYLSSCIDQVGSFNEILQLVIVELVHKVCRTDPGQRTRFIRCIYNLLDSSSSAVRYDAAGALVTLSAAPTAVSAAAQCYVDLIIKESDNNVKLIVLDRLAALKDNPKHERVLQNLAMDITRVLATPSLEVRRKTLTLLQQLATTRNAAELVGVLQKELAKTNSTEEFEKNAEYRQLLVRALHEFGVKFADLAAVIVPQLMEFLCEEEDATAGGAGKGNSASMDVILFVREAFEKLPDLRTEMLDSLLNNFLSIRNEEVCRATLWIIGEYAKTPQAIKSAMGKLQEALGALPIVASELSEAAEAEAAALAEESEGNEPTIVTKTRITADGTYATESVYTSKAKRENVEKPSLRKLLLDGSYFVAAAMSTTLTKMALVYQQLDGPTQSERNITTAEAMFMMSCVLHLGQSNIPSDPIGADSAHRIRTCLRILANPSAEDLATFQLHCHDAFVQMLDNLRELQHSARGGDCKSVVDRVQADDLIGFRALRVRDENSKTEDEFELGITLATGGNNSKAEGTKLSKVYQLSGFSDPVYAEAYVNVHQYDIMLDVLVVNQTTDTLQNLTLELATLGDLKLTEKPSSHTVGPHDFCNIKANVKVSSTETGIIFGNIVYDVTGATSDRNCVVLNDIHIDIMDYITQAYCDEAEFRSMWSEFEWENKVTVRTSIDTLQGYLDHLMSITNMRCLTPAGALMGDCDYLAANLYAKSVFGEDALANLSIEKGTDGQVTGHVRIRSKTQGIALSLGDKITLSQKGEGATPPE